MIMTEHRVNYFIFYFIIINEKFGRIELVKLLMM